MFFKPINATSECTAANWRLIPTMHGNYLRGRRNGKIKKSNSHFHTQDNGYDKKCKKESEFLLSL